SDYYPFGMQMPGRKFDTDEYRYGFQGQEKDDEIKGEGNSVNYKYRMHDPRIGRFFAVDPLAPEYPHNSPYAFSENRVIASVELEGLEAHDLNSGGTLHGPYSNEYVDELNSSGVSSVENYSLKFELTEGRDGEGLIAPVIQNDNYSFQSTSLVNDGLGEKRYRYNVAYQTDWAPTNRNGNWANITLEGTDIVSVHRTAFALGMGECSWCDAAQLNMDESALLAGGTTLATMNFAQSADKFISAHAYKRHRNRRPHKSSKSRTQYGENINVKKIRMQTVKHADDIVVHLDNHGTPYAVTYKKTFGYNISTKDTPTRESRVIINLLDAEKSTQFPLFTR
ncbi:MAG: RHS repeat-associated core domain-containing protein, partial [Flavobacteriales bacterium]